MSLTSSSPMTSPGPRPAASTSQPRVTIWGTVSTPSRVTPAGVESASVKPS
jgi:hypothetical protein